MELVRQKEVVEAYHYDIRTDQEGETEIQVNLYPIEIKGSEDSARLDTAIHVRVEFKILFDEFVISGAVSQSNKVVNRKINQVEDLNQEELNEFVAPLFSLIKRISFEVTEIALDQPGIELNFESNI